MKRRVVMAPKALQDLADLYDYLLPLAGHRIADDYVARLYQYCLSFETFPERGIRRDDMRSGLRMVGYRRKATIAFRVHDDAITIVRIFHGGRNTEFPEPDIE